MTSQPGPRARGSFEQREFTVRFATRLVKFRSDKFRDRGELASAIQQRRVITCVEQISVNGTMGRQTWLNLGLVEQIL